MNSQYDLFSYHNTTNVKGKELLKRENKALSQEDLILEYFRVTGKAYTPFDIQNRVLPRVPITSIRRAITNLTNRKLLVKTQEKVVEMYGVENYKWIHRDFF